MENFVLTFIEHGSWPSVALIIVLLLRSPIASMLSRVTEAKLPGGTALSLAKYLDGDSSNEAELVTETKAFDTTANWDKPANLFWLSHDLVWTASVLLGGGNRTEIARGLKQSQHHMSEVGLTASSPGRLLTKLHEFAQEAGELEWQDDTRRKVAQELSAISHEISSIARAKQGKYRGRP